jgi:hypothetical protein
MTMKKTDLVKNLAKKIDGRMKSTGVPTRFAQGAAEIAAQRGQRQTGSATKLVAVTCKLPAELVQRLRERALTQDGGVNRIVAEALARWLDQPAA